MVCSTANAHCDACNLGEFVNLETVMFEHQYNISFERQTTHAFTVAAMCRNRSQHSFYTENI